MNAIQQFLAQLNSPGLSRLIADGPDYGPPWEPLDEEHDLDLQEEFRKLMERERRSGDDLHRSIFDFNWD